MTVVRIMSLALVLLLLHSPAWAHKLRVFASAEGGRISGYAYFSGGVRAQEVTVTVITPDGQTVYQGRTDDQGQFGFAARQRSDHAIRVDGGDGHQADVIVSGLDLPPSLPAGAGLPVAASSSPIPAIPADLAGDDGLRAYLDQAVARQIRPLREQLDAYQEKIWWHDVVGGLGYIIGMGGLAFGLSMRRLNPRDRETS